MSDKVSNTEGISANQEKLILALLQSTSMSEAAQKAGVSTKTVQRWSKEPDFISAYRRARTYVYESAVGQLQAAAVEAVATLRNNLNHPTPASVQVRAALGILELAAKGVELYDIVERLERLESRGGSNGYYR